MSYVIVCRKSNIIQNNRFYKRQNKYLSVKINNINNINNIILIININNNNNNIILIIIIKDKILLGLEYENL